VPHHRNQFPLLDVKAGGKEPSLFFIDFRKMMNLELHGRFHFVMKRIAPGSPSGPVTR
jgi:hypothetical protein